MAPDRRDPGPVYCTVSLKVRLVVAWLSLAFTVTMNRVPEGILVGVAMVNVCC